MNAVCRQVGVPTFMSSTAALVLEGALKAEPPPDIRILPGRYCTADPSVIGVVPTCVHEEVAISSCCTGPHCGEIASTFPVGRWKSAGYSSSANSLVLTVGIVVRVFDVGS